MTSRPSRRSDSSSKGQPIQQVSTFSPFAPASRGTMLDRLFTRLRASAASTPPGSVIYSPPGALLLTDVMLREKAGPFASRLESVSTLGQEHLEVR